ncbi:MarR family winged helix-turn-helix transcriptional regulator [Leuconostoc sp. JNUCC 76]
MTQKFNSEFKDNAVNSVGLSFVKVYNLWHTRIKNELRKYNLTHPQFIVLSTLAYLTQHNDEVNQVNIAKHSDIDVMTTSVIIKNLEKFGFVTREASKKDTRSKVIKLTQGGLNIINETLPIVEEVDQNFFSVLKKEKSQFNNMLQLLITTNSTTE